MNTAARLTVRFVRAWDRNCFQLSLVSIPLIRGILFLARLAPAQLNEDVLHEPWQLLLLGALSVSALITIVGVMRPNLTIEQIGLKALGTFSVIYGLASIASDPHTGSVALVVYGVIAACSFSRVRKITQLRRGIDLIREARRHQAQQ